MLQSKDKQTPKKDKQKKDPNTDTKKKKGKKLTASARICLVTKSNKIKPKITAIQNNGFSTTKKHI